MGAGEAFAGKAKAAKFTTGFKDCSVPGKSKSLVRVVRPPKERAQLTVVAEMMMQAMRLVTVQGAAEVPASCKQAVLSSINGGIPMMMEPETWPEWVLFCERVDVLHRWSPWEVLFVLYMKLPIVNIRIETMLYMNYYDHLETEDCNGVV